MKSLAATEILLIVGMTAIAATMFVQVPKELEDMKQLMVVSSATTVAKDIAGLIATTVASPSDITILYKLPEGVNYTISTKDNFVYVDSTIDYIKVENATSKTLVTLDTTEMFDVKILEIRKFFENNQNKYEVKKHE